MNETQRIEKLEKMIIALTEKTADQSDRIEQLEKAALAMIDKTSN